MILCFWGGVLKAARFRAFVFFVYFTPNAHGLRHVSGSVSGSLASYTSRLVKRQGRGSGATGAVFAHRKKKKPFRSGVPTGFQKISSLFVVYRLSVFFGIIIDGKSCTSPISTNPASKEAGKLGLMCRTYFVACRLKITAVAVLQCSWWGVVQCGGIMCFFSHNEARPSAKCADVSFLPFG